MSNSSLHLEPPQLQPSPRKLSASMYGELLCGRPLNFGGWIVANFLLLFLLAFSIPSMIFSWVAFTGKLQTAPALIQDTQATGTSIMEKTVYAVYFKFKTPKGKTFKGTSYTIGKKSLGDQPMVEYQSIFPSIARIQDTSSHTSAPWLIVLLFLYGIAMFLALHGIRQRWQTSKLLRYGKLAVGKRTKKEEKESDSILQMEATIEYSFEYEAEDGNRYLLKTKEEKDPFKELKRAGSKGLKDSHQYIDMKPFRNTKRTLILYDSSDPRRALWWESIPAKPRIKVTGEIDYTPQNGLTFAVWSILPFAPFLALIIYYKYLM